MNTNSTLDQAEKRLPDVQAQAKDSQRAMSEAVRAEIGAKQYQEAKEKLVQIETAMNTTFRPFLNRMGALATKSPALPAMVTQWLMQMGQYCDQVPRSVRDGISGFETVIVPLGRDGNLDPNACALLVHSINFGLRAWDGCLRELTQLQNQVECHIRESGWPAAGPSEATIAPTPLHPAEGIKVEQDFKL